MKRLQLVAPEGEASRPFVPTRRTLLKGAAAMGMALGTLGLVEEKAVVPQRARLTAATSGLPDIQFDVGNFIAPAQTLNDGAGNITAQLPPTNTVFTTARLNRTPTASDQAMLSEA